MELIYHDENERDENGISRFSEVLGKIGKSTKVDIVAPYVSPDMLNRHFYGCKTRLLSDFDECFRMLTKNKAKEFGKIIKKTPEQFRHIAGLHAKVFLGNDLALVGSANLTQKGLFGRREMAVLIDEARMIAELREWFENLWRQGSQLSLKIMKNVIGELPIKQINKKPKHMFESKAPALEYKLIPKEKKSREVETEEEIIERIKDRIHRAPSREWIEGYFDLAKKAIHILGDAEQDGRVVFSCPEKKYIALQINRRFIMSAFPQKRLFLMIGAGDCIADIKQKDTLVKVEPFSSFGGKAPQNHLFYFHTDNGQFKNPELIENWADAIKTELLWIRMPLPREVDRPILYQIATDLEFRKAFLDDVYQNRETS